MIRNENLAELIGVVLGDGHIEKFPRTERLIISANSKNQGFIDRYSNLVQDIFNKEPTIMKSAINGGTRISIYQKHISSRLAIKTGSRLNYEIDVPYWIACRKKFILAYLRGLFEAEGSFGVHKATYTHKLSFSNHNKFILGNVYRLLKKIGFSPSIDRCRVQLSKKNEVYRCMELIQFRKY